MYRIVGDVYIYGIYLVATCTGDEMWTGVSVWRIFKHGEGHSFFAGIISHFISALVPSPTVLALRDLVTPL